MDTDIYFIQPNIILIMLVNIFWSDFMCVCGRGNIDVISFRGRDYVSYCKNILSQE